MFKTKQLFDASSLTFPQSPSVRKASVIMSSRQPLRGGIIPFTMQMAPPTISSDIQGPPHGISSLAGPVTAHSRPNGQGQVQFDNNNPLVRSAVRVSTAVSEAVATANDATNQARQMQRENHIAQLQLADAERVAAEMLVEMTHAQGPAERADVEMQDEISRPMPQAPAPPAFITNRRVTDLANEGITFQNGQRQTSTVYAQADQVNQARQSRESQILAQMQLLESRLDALSVALDECTIEKEDALRKLHLEKEDWKCLREAVDDTDGPKRELHHRISTNTLRVDKLRVRAGRMTGGIVRGSRQGRKIAEATRHLSPEPGSSPVAPAPARQHLFDVPRRPNLASQAATPAQGRSVQPVLQNPTSSMQQYDNRDRMMVDPISPLKSPDHGPGTPMPQPGAEEVRRQQLESYYGRLFLDTEMVGFELESEYRKDLHRREFPQHDCSVPIEVPMNGAVSVKADISMDSGVCSEPSGDVSMGGLSRGSAGVLYLSKSDIMSVTCDSTSREAEFTASMDRPVDCVGNAAVQVAPTTNFLPMYPRHMDFEWTVILKRPDREYKRSHDMFRGCSLPDFHDQGQKLWSEGSRKKRVLREMVNEGTGSAEPAMNATALTETVSEEPVVSAPAPREPAPTEHVPTDDVPTEAASSAPAVSEPAQAAEEPTESELTPEVSSESVGSEVATIAPTTTSLVTNPGVTLSMLPAVNVVGAPAPSEPALTPAVLTTPVPTEEVVGSPAPSEPAPTESEVAEPVETEEVRSMPGAYPASPEELVLPWVGSPETDVSEPAVPEPTPEVEEKVLEESSSNEVEAVDNNVNVAGDEEDCFDPWAIQPQRPRRVGGLTHLERLLANAPVAQADSTVPNREREQSRLASNSSEVDSRAGDSPEEKAETSAHAALQIAEEQRAPLEGSMATTSDPSSSEAWPTPSPAVNASNEYDVRSTGSALLRVMGPGARVAGFVICALVVISCAFVFAGRHVDTFAEVMAGPDRLLEELRTNHGFDISVLNRVVYVLVRWLAGDRALPG